MAISIDKQLGDFPAHLTLLGQRSTLLASNIANTDTPGYKARDIDFRTALAAASGNQMAMKTTNDKHIGGAGSALSQPDLLYRVPHQSSLDGNTVDAQVEKAEFAQNALRYQSTLTFLSGKFKGLQLAIKGQ